MSAYVERLCDHCGVVRVGASAPFPAPYNYSVTYVIRDGWAEPVGFDQPKIPRSDYELIIRSINDATGKLVAYDRAGPPSIRVVQIDPRLTNGKIIMEKHEIPHASHAKNADGSYNVELICATAEKAIANLRNNHGKVHNFEEGPSPVEGAERRLILDVSGH